MNPLSCSHSLNISDLSCNLKVTVSRYLWDLKVIIKGHLPRASVSKTTYQIPKSNLPCSFGVNVQVTNVTNILRHAQAGCFLL